MLDQAEILEAVGQLQPAEELLEAAVLKAPEDRALWGNLANVRFRLGKMEAAERAYALSEKFGPVKLSRPAIEAISSCSRKITTPLSIGSLKRSNEMA